MSSHDPADRRLVEHLRRNGAASVGDLVDLLGVTATAVRQRLNRLMAEGLIERKLAEDPEKPASRGRPSYHYQLTQQGLEAGDNYTDLARAMWEEIRAIPDPEVRVGLVKRLASKLATQYADSTGDSEDLAERMRRLMRVMGEREVPVDIDESGDLPVLTMLACPYPELAAEDRSVCSMEKVMISEVLGQGVKLSECRLDGGGCCSFEPSKNGTPTNSEEQPTP